jgi:hypothetical protein
MGQRWWEGTSWSSGVHDFQQQGRLMEACAGKNHTIVAGYRNLERQRGWDQDKTFEWPFEWNKNCAVAREKCWKVIDLECKGHLGPHSPNYTYRSVRTYRHDNTNLLISFQITEGAVCIENSIIRETLNGSAVALDSFFPLLLLHEIISLE